MKELDLNLVEMRREATTDLIAALRTGLKRLEDIEALGRVLNGQVGGVSRPNGQTPEVSEAAPIERRKSAPRTDRTKLAELALPYIQRNPGATTKDVMEFLRRTGGIPLALKAGSAEMSVRIALQGSPRFHATRNPDKIGTPFQWFVRASEKLADAKPNGSTPEAEQNSSDRGKLRRGIINLLLKAPRQGMTRREISVALGRSEKSDPEVLWRLRGLLKSHQAELTGKRQNGRYTLIKRPFVVAKQPSAKTEKQL